MGTVSGHTTVPNHEPRWDCGGQPQVVLSEAVVHLEATSCPSKAGFLDTEASQ